VNWIDVAQERDKWWSVGRQELIKKMEIFPDTTTRVSNMTLYVPVLEGNVRKMMPFGRLLLQSPINQDISNFCKQAVVSV